VRALTDELKQLLEHNNTAFDDEIIRRQMELLGNWMECYRTNLVAPATFSETGVALLNDMRARLKLSIEEQQRLEGEGGNPSTKEQVEKTEELLKVIRRSEKLLAEVEALFPEHHMEPQF
jgi:hypothetical protein